MKRTILATFLAIGFVVAVTGAISLQAQEGIEVRVIEVLDERDIEGPVLVVEIKNVLNPKGTLMVGIFDKEEDYTDNSLPQSPKVKVTETGIYVVEVKGLEPGRYAVVIYHDFNENMKLDKNFVGMPKEPYAFSNYPEPPRGAPKFETCLFDLPEEGARVSLALPGK